MSLKKKEPLTEEEIYKLNIQQEQDLARLKRQYEILSKDNEHYYRTCRESKHPKHFTVMKREHQNILTDLGVASCKTKSDAKITEKISALLQDKDLYEFKVSKEKQYNVEIQQQIEIVKKDVHELRSQNIENIQNEEHFSNYIAKTIETQENKLEVQVKKFGSVCSELVGLREEIRNMLYQRDAFMQIWGKLTKKLVLGKKIMMDLIEQATIAYDQREEWCNKLKSLRIKAHQDLVLDTENLVALKRKQENDEKILDFYTIKQQTRVMEDLRRKEAMRREQTKNNLLNQKQKYKELLNEILEFTKGSSLETIAKNFWNQEARNFSYITCITQLIEEMEDIGDKLGCLHLDIEEKNLLNNLETQTHQNDLKALEALLQASQKQYQESEDELKEHETYFQQILNGINELFKICHCDGDSLLNLLSGTTTITIHNVMFYIRSIERKVLIALLEIFYRDKVLYDKRKLSYNKRLVRESKSKPMIYPIEMIICRTPCPLCYLKISDRMDRNYPVWNRSKVKRSLVALLQSGDQESRVHNVSACQLPTSRRIIQKRYT